LTTESNPLPCIVSGLISKICAYMRTRIDLLGTTLLIRNGKLHRRATEDAVQLVVTVMVNMTCGDGDETAVHEELKAWAKFVDTERPSWLLAPTSMCYQHSELLGNGAPPNEPVRLLPGWSGIAIGHRDVMCGTQFSVHPLSFYQVRDPRCVACIGDWCAVVLCS
jgi:hypothetical protein